MYYQSVPQTSSGGRAPQTRSFALSAREAASLFATAHAPSAESAIRDIARSASSEPWGIFSSAPEEAALDEPMSVELDRYSDMLLDFALSAADAAHLECNSSGTLADLSWAAVGDPNSYAPLDVEWTTGAALDDIMTGGVA
ncbi:hypothetical protein EXIGLDRAFT_778722, partial [Exidia glandulosa HHB12029]